MDIEEILLPPDTWPGAGLDFLLHQQQKIGAVRQNRRILKVLDQMIDGTLERLESEKNETQSVDDV